MVGGGKDREEMSRLIDADKFKHYVKEHCKDSLADLWCVLIDRQHTAFDTEKVVEQLEEININYFLTIANTGSEKLDIAYGYASDSINKAIDIVKKGGVE